MEEQEKRIKKVLKGKSRDYTCSTYCNYYRIIDFIWNFNSNVSWRKSVFLIMPKMLKLLQKRQQQKKR